MPCLAPVYFSVSLCPQRWQRDAHHAEQLQQPGIETCRLKRRVETRDRQQSNIERQIISAAVTPKPAALDGRAQALLRATVEFAEVVEHER